MTKVRLFSRLIPVALAAALTLPDRADATLRIVGLPKSGDAHQIQTAIASWALGLPPGDTLMMFDARDATLIGSIAIPNNPSLARPERKVPFILPGMAALKKYLAAMPAADPGNPNLINASPFLDQLGPVIADHGSDGVRILLLGGPWFSAPGALEKKEYVGSYPSDGLIIGDRSHSPFGTQDRHDLNGATVDYCYTGGANGFLNPEHHERVERAWSLMIARRGGHLTTFSGDTKTCFDRFGEEKTPAARVFAIDATDATMQYMYRAQDAAPRIINAPPVKTGASSAPPSARTMSAEAARFERPARTTPPSTRTGSAWFGIQWNDRIDLDLYVRCSPNSPFLFYGNQHTPEGRHNFDYRMGSGSEFETVDLTAACADIGKAEVYINFYEGAVRASPKGVFAIEFDGGLYKSNFEIPALTGNNGHGLSYPPTMGAPYWVKIDLAKVLKLDANVAAHSRNHVTR